MNRTLLNKHGQFFLLALVLAIAIFLRLYGQNWDQGTYQHPDERFIAMVSANRVEVPHLRDIGSIFNPATSPINPRRDDENGNPLSFAYGTLPIAVQQAAGWTLNLFSDRDWNSYRDLYRVGRTLTALADTLTVALVFLIGRRLFGVAAGLLASMLYASSVLAIQLAHFFAVDTWLTLFVTATLYLLMRFLERPTLGWSLATGAVIGMAFATKASVPALLAPVLATYAYVFWKSEDRRHVLGIAAAGGLVSLLFFTMFEPYALIRIRPFVEDIRLQARIVRGQFDIPYTRQFVGLTPGIYELRNMFAYTMGPGLLLAALAGTIWASWRAITSRHLQLAIPVLWVLAYLPVTLTTEARFLRYSLPIFPVLTVFAAGLLVWVISHPRFRIAGQAATVAVLASTAIWAAGFLSIYSHEHTRLEASDWIFENIPAGSVLTAESWDDPLPIRTIYSPMIPYDIRTLDMYGDQMPEDKVAYLYNELREVDYIVLSSNRLVDSVDNLPWRYAVQNEFYRRLDAGQLGFQLVYEGLVQPELFGITYDDRNADESFTVYDHPHVRIYQRSEMLTAGEFRERFLWSINQPWQPTRYPVDKWLMLDRPVEEISTSDQTNWNTAGVRSGVFAAFFWLLAIEVVGVSVLPLAAGLLRRSPDRGTLSSRLIGIVLIGWLVWIGASLELWPATAWTVAAITAAVALVCWIPVVLAPAVRRSAMLPSLGNYLASLALVAGVFLAFLLLRAIYPDFWQTYYGGEKPFELAYLRAVARSTEFPPYDPWYADGIINYYYYGWHLVASLIRLSGVGITHGFQLGVATAGALLVAQSVAFAGLLSRTRRGWIMAGVPVSGLVVAFFVAVAGNVDALFQVLRHGNTVTDLFDFWHSTRVIDYVITEFPYFSVLWADLHPHLMNLPHYVLLIVLLTSMVLDVRRFPEEQISFLQSGTIALVLGTITVTNSWDAPMAIALTVGAFLYTGALRGGSYWLTGTGYGVLTVLVSFFLFAPFHTRFYSVVDGVARASESSPAGQFLTHWGTFMVVLGGLLAGAAIRRRFSSPLNSPAILIPAAFAGLGGLGALISFVRGSMPSGWFLPVLVVGTVLLYAAPTAPQIDRLNRILLAVGIVLAGGSGLLAASIPSVAIAGVITLCGMLPGLTSWRQPYRAIPWILVAAAGAILVGVELIYVADDLRNSPWERMNSVFKFSIQAWVLLALGLIVLAMRSVQWPRAGFSRKNASRAIVLVALVTAAVVGSLYPLLGTPARLSQNMTSSPGGLTLDGYAWMRNGWIHNGTGDVMMFNGDLDAIRWLNKIEGTPVILEGSIGPYRGNGARISSGTGLPAVLGWDRHQYQQRYGSGISQRMAEVRMIYNETDPLRKLEMLRSYNVRYVIVGDVERLWNTPENPQPYASAEGLDAFDLLIGHGLKVAFTSAHTTIYEVEDFPRLPRAVGQ
jgi:YYY domain-containing protein